MTKLQYFKLLVFSCCIDTNFKYIPHKTLNPYNTILIVLTNDIWKSLFLYSDIKKGY